MVQTWFTVVHLTFDLTVTAANHHLRHASVPPPPFLPDASARLRRPEDRDTFKALQNDLARVARRRMLWRHGRRNQRWRIYERFLVGENRWRAQRYGTAEGLIDFGARAILPFDGIVAEWTGLIEEDAGALKSTEEVLGAQAIVRDGTSAARQRAVMAAGLAAGQGPEEALRGVVRHLIEEFHADL